MSTNNKIFNHPIKIDAISEEPWVELASGNELVDWNKNDEIIYNQTFRQTEKLTFYRKAFDFITDNRIFGDYHEYGCHRGRTFRMALTEARRHNLNNMQFHAFDSFGGLPSPESETSVEIWKQGALFTTEEEFLRLMELHGIYTQNIKTIKGYYSDTLNNNLKSIYAKTENKLSLVNIDCDLYESAIPVFKFIESLLQEGTVIYIDDFFTGYKGNPNKGVARAFIEFQNYSKWNFIRYLDVGAAGRSYIVYSGKKIDFPV